MRSLTFFLSFSFVLSQFTSAQTCGGKERWAVKGGTDPNVNQVDLNNIIPIDLTQVVLLPTPQMPATNDNTTRVVPDETHVYRITGRLIKWKKECCDPTKDDSDYHLVITDDSLKYSDEHAHPSVPVQKTSLVAELPDVSCLPGRDGGFGDTSPFFNTDTDLDVVKSRANLEAHTPNFATDGSWNDMQAARVEIVGVGFFDRAHQQTGRSWNNIEMHPVLSLKFLDDAPQPSGPEPPTPIPPSNPATAQWQYETVSAATSDELLSKANTEGAQGWELVSVVLDPARSDKYVGYLKRKK